MEIEVIDPSKPTEWDVFLSTQDNALLYYSSAYRRFLQRIIPLAKPYYLLARDGGVPVGGFPIMILDAPDGRIANSLPFYGSNGAPLAVPDSDVVGVKQALIGRALEICEAQEVSAMTVISNPLDPDVAIYEALIGNEFPSERIGQFTPLTAELNEEAAVGEILMAQMHQKTRNMVRKGLKGAFEVKLRSDNEAWMGLYSIHQENMASIGGLAKPQAVFDALRATFKNGSELRLYTAERDGNLAAALLMLYFNGIAEYFTPVIDQRFRSEQPLSLLIFKAMKDAALDGCRWWNWGGTWLNQGGVYRFKNRWGARDLPYYYYTKVWDYDILKCTPQQLLNNFPFFYVVPFDMLKPE